MTPSHVIFGWWLHIFLRQGRFGPGPVGSNDTIITQEVYNSNAFISTYTLLYTLLLTVRPYSKYKWDTAAFRDEYYDTLTPLISVYSLWHNHLRSYSHQSQTAIL